MDVMFLFQVMLYEMKRWKKNANVCSVWVAILVSNNVPILCV